MNPDYNNMYFCYGKKNAFSITELLFDCQGISVQLPESQGRKGFRTFQLLLCKKKSIFNNRAFVWLSKWNQTSMCYVLLLYNVIWFIYFTQMYEQFHLHAQRDSYILNVLHSKRWLLAREHGINKYWNNDNPNSKQSQMLIEMRFLLLFYNSVEADVSPNISKIPWIYTL